MRRGASRARGLPLVALLLAPGCASDEPVSSARPSVVLITSDTLRRDHLGCYGYFRDTTPRIDAFAAECVLFEEALATMATTLPSHLSMLTGLYAHQHGMPSNRAAVRDPFRSGEGRRTLTEALCDAGYRTAAFVSSAPLASRTGMAVGFEHYSEPAGNLRRGMQTVREAVAWLDERAREPAAPFFLWVHLWEPHDPNKPRGAYATLFDGGPELEAWVERQGLDADAVERTFRPVPELLTRFVSEEHAGEPLDRAAILDVVDRYDADVRYVDDCVGDLIDALRARGLLETSVVAFTGDHGQSLGELGWLGHARILDPNLFVPLLVRAPGVPARRVPGVVSLVDLLPTLVGRLPGDFTELLAQAEGVDLLATDGERGGVLAQQTARELHVPEHSGVQFALYEGRWKLWEAPGQPARLHDREGAGDRVDVAAEHPDVVERLRARLEALLTRRPFVGGVGGAGDRAGDAELLEALEALGYVGEE